MNGEERATVLLVEDDEGLARLLTRRLERAGYTVVGATTAEEGLQRIARGGLDLILLDQRLPGGASGLDLYRQVKADGRDIPAVLVTGFNVEGIVLQALRAGVRDFVPKTPDYLDQVLPVVARVLKETRAARQLAAAETRLIREQAARAEAERSAEALRASEERFRRMVESVKDYALFTCDAHGIINMWNTGAERLFGYAEAEILGQSVAVLFTPEDRAAGLPERELAKAAQTGRSGDDRCHLRRDGSQFFAEGTITPIRDAAGQLRGFTKVAHDITERQQAAQKLAASEVRYRRLFEAAQDAILILDAKTGKVLDANPSVKNLLGYTHDELLGLELWQIGLAADEQASRLVFRQLQEQGSLRYEDLPLRTKAGERREVEFVGSVYSVNNHHVIQCNIRDISARKQAEEALKEAARRKDEFLATLAHELRNPLAPVRNALYLMQFADQDRELVAQARQMIERQVEHLVRLVDDLLDVSRITRGKINLQTEAVDLAAVLTHAVESSRPLISARQHNLEVTLPKTPLPMEGDPVRLAQVFLNLLNNAAKYTPEGGRIWLTAEVVSRERERSEAVIRVRDTGVGIPREMLPKVFDLFTQLDRTLDRSEGGLGIGLTLVRRLTEMHGGRVQALSAGSGQGSEFVVRLPLAVGGESWAVGSSDSLPTAHDSPPIARRRILVVDDNQDSAESLALLLRLFGNDVRTVHDGHLALAVAEAYRPDVVLLDIGLPGMNGYDVARALRKMPTLGNVVLVALTGYGAEEDRRLSHEAGFNAHLVKPVDLEALQGLLARPELAGPVPKP